MTVRRKRNSLVSWNARNTPEEYNAFDIN